jgi:hypothetical protein
MSRKPRGKGTRIDRVFVDETTGSTVVTDEDQYIGLTLRISVRWVRDEAETTVHGVLVP